MRRRISLKSPSGVSDPVARDCLHGLVEAVEQITGARSKRIAPLPPDASMQDVIAKVNEILARVQG